MEAMTDPAAIRKLIEAVEAGNKNAVDAALAIIGADPPIDVFPDNWCSLIASAYRGSMDAALSFMKAVLPGWWCELRISTRPRAVIGYMDATAEGQAPTPARALLLATLKAMEAGHGR